jgi:Putative beta-barrel porin-2, OmpL-like. bbp2
MKHQMRKKQLRVKNHLAATGTILSMIAGAGLNAHAQATTENDKINDLEKQNQALQQQLDTLEDMAKKQGLMPSGSDPAVSAMSDMTISGFVQTSYFYNVDRPDGGYSAGYLWDTKDNNFSLNKVKITLASPPAERSGDKWDAGYRVSLMAGEDAPVLNTGSGTTGFDWLREAYVDLNVPIGTGLNIKAGELISLLNYESGDGGAANENFSQGYQWYYTGNGPETGIQLDYAFTDWLDVKFRVENGLYGGNISTTSKKGVMGSIDLKPNDKLWVNLTGFGGEGVGTIEADGGEILAGYQVTKQLGTGLEWDYFHLTHPTDNLWSIGGWMWYDFTSEVGLAFRADFVDQKDGEFNFDSPPYRGVADAGIASTLGGGHVASFTLTLNLKPAPNIKIQPEIRYDTTSYGGGFNGKDYQFILGCGASYLF